MKLKASILILGIVISSFGASELKVIPEATNLHPDLYTIQFILADLDENFQLNPLLQTTNIFMSSQTKFYSSEMSELSEEKSKMVADFLMKKQQNTKDGGNTNPTSAMVDQIQKSNPEYSNFATVHVSPDIEFSGRDGDVKGKLDSESNCLDILHLKIPDYGLIDPLTIAINTTEWHTLFISGKIINGKEKKYCLLVKSYKPTR